MGLLLLDGQPELPAMNPELSILHQVVRNGIAKALVTRTLRRFIPQRLSSP